MCAPGLVLFQTVYEEFQYSCRFEFRGDYFYCLHFDVDHDFDNYNECGLKIDVQVSVHPERNTTVCDIVSTQLCLDDSQFFDVLKNVVIMAIIIPTCRRQLRNGGAVEACHCVIFCSLSWVGEWGWKIDDGRLDD